MYKIMEINCSFCNYKINTFSNIGSLEKPLVNVSLKLPLVSLLHIISNKVSLTMISEVKASVQLEQYSVQIPVGQYFSSLLLNISQIALQLN